MGEQQMESKLAELRASRAERCREMYTDEKIAQRAEQQMSEYMRRDVCLTGEVVITEEQKAGVGVDSLSGPQIRDYIGPSTTLEWKRVTKHYFADTDGRIGNRVLGTPGGDLAEFILLM